MAHLPAERAPGGLTWSPKGVGGGETGKAATISRLLSAAREEFAARGYADAKIDAIARAAGVTKQLIYHYYRDKEELFSCVLDDVSAQVMGDLLERAFEQEPGAAFRGFVGAIIDQYRDEPTLGPLAIEGIRYHNAHPSANEFPRLAPALISKFEMLLQRGVAAGLFRADVDPRALLGLIVLAATGAFTNRYSLSIILGVDSTSPSGIEQWRSAVLDLLAGAIAGPRFG